MYISSDQRESVHQVYQEMDEDKKMEISDEIYRKLLEKKEKDSNSYIREYQTSQGWTVVSVLDLSAGKRGLSIITANIVAISIVLMVGFGFAMMMILRKIMNPVVVLAEHMRKTGENLIEKIEEPESRDEVGTLISSFNQMVDTNSSLVQKIAQDEKEKRQLELALLQMQIKPHFLYNTLDTAFCLNSMRMHREANYVIKQLAGYYRLVLNHGDEWISFSEELDAVEKYLDIQSVRYSELISYSISVDEELYEFRIPKMTLQPLVENAIYHGIKPCGRKGHILIMGEFCNDEVTISITDDGIGMTEEMFEDILSGKRKSTDRESFGMKSVAERLRLFYGENAKMELSKTVMGTCIVLTVNLRKDG